MVENFISMRSSVIHCTYCVMSKIYIAKLCMVKKYGLLADLAYITKGNRVIIDEILNSELLRNVLK